ncbi:MAG TPA: ankyrin repeat domain-containing protein [Pyrinomonadaceae bacterium]|nr:ankyrin repeat domain-containing protein [Pyrinomonadaceae bacterium]
MAPKNFLNNITIPSPCTADWNSMIGNDQVRFCQHCKLNVHDLSAISRNQAERLVAKSNGRLCIRYVRDPLGRLVNLPATQKLHRISRRASRFVAGAFTATLSISSAVAQSSPASRLRAVDTPAATQPVELGRTITGTITDGNGAVISGATIFISNNELQVALYAGTNDAGEFKVERLPDGVYEMRVEAPGFAPHENERVFVSANSTSRVDRTLQVAQIDEITEIPIERLRFAMGGAMAVATPDSPFIRAAQEDDLEQLTALLAGTDVNARDVVTHTTALEHAVRNANREMIQLLLSAGASVNARNDSGETVLMMIDSDATSDLIWDLINAGAKVNLSDVDHNTALMRAAAVGNVDALKTLLEAGAKPDVRNKDGETALMQAASEGYVNVVRALVVAGADINLKDNEGNSPIDRALDGGHSAVVRFLKSKGAFESPVKEEKEEEK